MYERVGGDEFFEKLTRHFYDAVAADPVLRPLYPPDEASLERSRVHLRDFLIQYWGGPPTYGELRGPPRLRMRHAPFRIGPAERAAWLRAMSLAVAAGGLDPAQAEQLMSYFTMTADHMVNSG